MKSRNLDYFARQKAKRSLMHPGDLKSFLIAEFDSSRNIVVKKDILKTLEKLEQMKPVEEPA
jgi:hypothetical protein